MSIQQVPSKRTTSQTSLVQSRRAFHIALVNGFASAKLKIAPTTRRRDGFDVLALVDVLGGPTFIPVTTRDGVLLHIAAPATDWASLTSANWKDALSSHGPQLVCMWGREDLRGKEGAGEVIEASTEAATWGIIKSYAGAMLKRQEFMAQRARETREIPGEDATDVVSSSKPAGGGRAATGGPCSVKCIEGWRLLGTHTSCINRVCRKALCSGCRAIAPTGTRVGPVTVAAECVCPPPGDKATVTGSRAPALTAAALDRAAALAHAPPAPRSAAAAAATARLKASQAAAIEPDVPILPAATCAGAPADRTGQDPRGGVAPPARRSPPPAGRGRAPTPDIDRRPRFRAPAATAAGAAASATAVAAVGATTDRDDHPRPRFRAPTAATAAGAASASGTASAAGAAPDSAPKSAAAAVGTCGLPAEAVEAARAGPAYVGRPCLQPPLRAQSPARSDRSVSVCSSRKSVDRPAHADGADVIECEFASGLDWAPSSAKRAREPSARDRRGRASHSPPPTPPVECVVPVTSGSPETTPPRKRIRVSSTSSRQRSASRHSASSTTSSSSSDGDDDPAGFGRDRDDGEASGPGSDVGSEDSSKPRVDGGYTGREVDVAPIQPVGPLPGRPPVPPTLPFGVRRFAVPPESRASLRDILIPPQGNAVDLRRE